MHVCLGYSDEASTLPKLYTHMCICACMHLRPLQLPYLCVLAMQVAASEETVPGCDEYSGCPCATAAKVRGMGGEEE